MSEKALFTVIIPTMNRYDSLKRTLQHLVKSSVRPNEIVVVDQTQDKMLAAQIHKLCKDISDYIKYIKEEEASLTKARNIGIKNAHNDILIFMDDDVDVKEYTFENIVSIMSNDDKISMIGGLNDNDIMCHKNSSLGYIFGKSSYKNRYIGHVTKAMYSRFPEHCEKLTSTQWAMGFFFVVKKSLLEKWNIYFDEHLKYYAYAEDMDFTYSYYKKSKEENMHCIMTTDVIVTHNVSTEYRTPKFSSTFMVILHREYLSYKHYPNDRTSRFACLWCNLGDFLQRCIHGDNPMSVLKAQLFCEKYHRDVRHGNFHYELFMDH